MSDILAATDCFSQNNLIAKNKSQIADRFTNRYSSILFFQPLSPI